MLDVLFQPQPPGAYVSMDDLAVLFLVPILGGVLVMYVAEDLLGHAEYKATGITGAVLLALALIAGPEFDPGVARALSREFGWQIGFQVGRPLTFYWGLWGALLLGGAYDERQEAADESGT